MKVSPQQLLIAALAGGFIQEALALALPNPVALSTTRFATDKAVGDISTVNKKRNDGVVPLGWNLLPRADDDNGDDGDYSVELFQRSVFARGSGTGHDDDGHVDGTAHDGTTGDGTSDGTSDSGSQSDMTGGLTSGQDTTTGGLTSNPPKDPPAAVCKRDACTYTSAGYPDKPPAPSKDDKATLKNLEKKMAHPEKNTADVYKGRYKTQREKHVTGRNDPAQPAKDEATFKKYNDNYEAVKQDKKALTQQQIKDATALGIKDPGKLQVWEIYSKTNGKRDGQRMAELLVSDDGKTVISSYTFAKFDGNLNKLDNKGNPKSTGPDEFERQPDAYSKDHRLSNSDINWAFLNKITNGDKEKARAITFWMREHVINKGTVAQIYRSHFAMGWPAGIRGKFTLKGESGNPQEIIEFQALMGTENLSPLGYMYADHVQYFDGRFVTEIYTYPFDETNIWVKIGKPDGGNLPRVS